MEDPKGTHQARKQAKPSQSGPALTLAWPGMARLCLAGLSGLVVAYHGGLWWCVVWGCFIFKSWMRGLRMVSGMVLGMVRAGTESP